MKLLQRILARLTGNHTVDGILSSITNSINRLEALEQRTVDEIDQHILAIDASHTALQLATDVKARATAVREKLKALVS